MASAMISIRTSDRGAHRPDRLADALELGDLRDDRREEQDDQAPGERRAQNLEQHRARTWRRSQRLLGQRRTGRRRGAGCAHRLSSGWGHGSGVLGAAEADVAGRAVGRVGAARRRRGSAGSTTRGRGTTRRASPVRSPSGGPVGSRRARLVVAPGSNQSAHHSHTLPVMLCRPKPLGGNASTGAVPAYPSAAVLRVGEAALEDVHPVLAAGLELVAPREARRSQPAARGVLPLGLGGQPGAGPRAVGAGRRSTTRGRPGGRPGRRASDCGPVGVAPVGALHLPPPRRVRDDRARRREVVGEEAGEHERPAERARPR